MTANCRSGARALLILLLLGGASAGTAQASGHPHRGSQQLAALNHDTEAFSAPAASSARVTELSDVRPITGERTVLPVLATARGPHGRRWLEVLIPGRPNSHTGWIQRRATTESFTRWRIVVALSTRTVTVFRGGRVARVFQAVVGKPTTPTPTGHFFVEETVALSPQASGAPYALALSARSNALHEFDGGPGQIAFHGIDNIGGIPGTAASHGCVRLATPAITWLARHIAPGVPVTIRG
jgi:lipoprotein-anchoring transpeptidase ErfK/SrfK